MFEVPVLFIIFNRVDTAQKVFDAIREQKPKYLYVAADGPRKHIKSDTEKCQQARDIIKQVDWDCELKTFFRDENLGSGSGVSKAIDWFFENVDQGIIFEHDCLPHPDFFEYCRILLDKYIDNDRIMFIGGNNFQNGIVRGNASFYFSAFDHIWGWATWKKTWNLYRYDINSIPEEKIKEALQFYFGNDVSIHRYWLRIFRLMRKFKIATWDYQLTLSLWINKGLSIIPNKNLVSNIGFGSKEAVHSYRTIKGMANLPALPILPLVYPDSIEQNKEADIYFSYRFKLRRSIFKILKTPARETVYFFMRLLNFGKISV
ncbi:MAG: nucleotide-diphospho-sugar transferase [Flavobacteriaceae bacterium]|jgi:hypothetical protein|nr:nucleotide-diphospho-sugar transferase [Flavobacteriaceae bacterium]